MKARLIGAVCACLSMASLSTVVNAAIVDNGSYTTDTDSGLDWLDLTATAGMSYNQVSAQLGSGGSLEGWTYASRAQVGALWSAFGGDANYYNGFSTQNNGLFGVMAPLVGDLYCSIAACTQGNGYSYWITGDTSTINNQYVSLSFDHDIFPITSTQDQFSLTQTTINVSIRDDYYGSALIRPHVSAVPLPVAGWLFGTGLLGLIGVARRKKA